MKKYLLLTAILFIAAEAKAQNPTNLERMNELLGNMFKAVGPVWRQTGIKSLRLNLEGDLKYFEGRILQEEKSLLTEEGEEYILSIAEVKVHYRNPERDGLFGELVYRREVFMKIEWYSKSGGLKDFASSISDGIPESAIADVEQSYLPFTVGRKDPPGFFTGYFEEITAAVVTGIAAYLFFSVRSK